MSIRTVTGRGLDIGRLSARIHIDQTAFVWLAVAALMVIASILSPNFLSTTNLLNVLRQASVLGILAVGQTFVLLVAGADLSQSTLMALSACLAFNLLNGQDTMILPVVVLCLAVGAVVGLFNGLMVSLVRVPPFLMTLGTQAIVFGIGLIFTSGAPQGHITPLFRQLLGQTYVLGIPGQVLFWAAAILGGFFLLTRTAFGRKLYAVGGNRKTARLSGVRVERILLAAYLMSGVLAALAGLVLGARSGNADNTMGTGYELDAIAATVIGGTSFAGGRGGLVGTVGGVMLMTVLRNVLNILGFNPDAYLVAMGIVIIGATIAVKTDQ